MVSYEHDFGNNEEKELSFNRNRPPPMTSLGVRV